MGKRKWQMVTGQTGQTGPRDPGDCSSRAIFIEVPIDLLSITMDQIKMLYLEINGEWRHDRFIL